MSFAPPGRGPAGPGVSAGAGGGPLGAAGAFELEPLPFEIVQELCTWIDSITLSRPKRSMARDFSDGVLFAELIHYYYPKLVELHNYSAANGLAQKRYNWNTLCQKPLRKLRVKPDPALIEAIVEAKPNAIEHLLYQIQPLLLAGESTDSKTASKMMMKNMGTQGSGNRAQGLNMAIGEPAPRLQTVSASQQQFQNTLVNGGMGQGQAPAMGTNSSAAHTSYQMGPASDTSTVWALQEQVNELRDMNGLLEAKVAKLQQLVRLKDERIKALVEKLEEFSQ